MSRPHAAPRRQDSASRTSGGRRRIVVVQRIVPHYRTAFFEKLRDRLEADGIDLEVAYGQEVPGQVPRSVELKAPWARRVRNSYLTLGSHIVVWQPVGPLLGGVDLVVLEAANSILSNYLIAYRRRRAGLRVAYWGHGVAMGGRDSRRGTERLRARATRRGDWWFTYASGGAKSLEAAGVPAARITVVNNTIDAEEFRRDVESVTAGDLTQLGQALGIDSDAVGLFCGRMYSAKRIQFLLDAATAIRRRVPNFHLILIGDGPDSSLVEAAAHRSDWLHYVGPKYGRDRAPFFRLSKLVLMPGLVGLSIIDCFASAVPLFTTNHGQHSPEIEYLQDGENGVIAAVDVAEYADAISGYLEHRDRLDRLVRGCIESAGQFGLDEMVKRFAGGVTACLAAEARGAP